jgi:hypothetical protein
MAKLEIFSKVNFRLRINIISNLRTGPRMYIAFVQLSYCNPISFYFPPSTLLTILSILQFHASSLLLSSFKSSETLLPSFKNHQNHLQDPQSIPHPIENFQQFSPDFSLQFLSYLPLNPHGIIEIDTLFALFRRFPPKHTRIIYCLSNDASTQPARGF